MHKSITGVQVKDAQLGLATAVFATYDVIDRDGDVITKGAIKDGTRVVISSYGHGSWDGKLPVGKGVLRSEGDQALCDMEFFMGTTHGAETFKTIAALEDLQEWSFSLQDVKAARGQWDGKPARIIESVGTVKEVSPVLVGAGIDTTTIATKGAATKQLESSIRCLLRSAAQLRWGAPDVYVYVHDYDLDEGFAVFCIYDYETGDDRLVQVAITERTDTTVTLADEETDVHETEVYLPKSGSTFREQITSVLADVEALANRAGAVVALRATKGKTLSDETASLLGQLTAAADQIKALIAGGADPEPDSTTPPGVAEALQLEFLRYVASTAQGVTNP